MALKSSTLVVDGLNLVTQTLPGEFLETGPVKPNDISRRDLVVG